VLVLFHHSHIVHIPHCYWWITPPFAVSEIDMGSNVAMGVRLFLVFFLELGFARRGGP
jgi:hypothetical protein